VQNLVQEMRLEQQTIRDWVDSQAAQQGEDKASSANGSAREDRLMNPMPPSGA
jgi:hypothetical protein